jgi:hypothetical protein
MEDKPDKSAGSLGSDYVVVGKQDIAAKEGVLFIEARIRDELMLNPQLKVSVSKAR